MRMCTHVCPHLKQAFKKSPLCLPPACDHFQLANCQGGSQPPCNVCFWRICNDWPLHCGGRGVEKRPLSPGVERQQVRPPGSIWSTEQTSLQMRLNIPHTPAPSASASSWVSMKTTLWPLPPFSLYSLTFGKALWKKESADNTLLHLDIYTNPSSSD